MDLFTYGVFAFVYVLVIYFAIGLKNELTFYGMIVFFLLGAFVGWWLQSYATGLVLAVILSLIFW